MHMWSSEHGFDSHGLFIVVVVGAFVGVDVGRVWGLVNAFCWHSGVTQIHSWSPFSVIIQRKSSKHGFDEHGFSSAVNTFLAVVELSFSCGRFNGIAASFKVVGFCVVVVVVIGESYNWNIANLNRLFKLRLLNLTEIRLIYVK